MKKLLILLGLTGFAFTGCEEMQQIASQIPTGTGEGIGGVSGFQISQGLKQALEIGVEDGVKTLGKKDGFFKNSMTKILLPEELQTVDRTLRSIGLGSLADEGLKLLNRAAEDAVTEAAPIFKNAIMGMTFNDAKGILLGNNNAATTYLENKTSTQLFTAFQPKVKNSLGKVGADDIWAQIITQYNNFTGKSVTTDLNAYVTQQAINGVFKMVAQKEEGIRNNIGLRTTPLLKEVFGLQDKK
ncbi:MAG: DUF4197 domain-containing protein [Flavobacteriia bacterium]|nr:DUF4197 domain-containing protein [Flavobacteriia bacterium]